MDVDAGLTAVPAAGALGLALSVGIERLLRPRPSAGRPGSTWGIHSALWCAAYGLLVLLLGRPWCAMAAVSALLATLTFVNNAKWKSLREPFIFQDYDYFLDAVRYPRLFLPFLGVKNFFLAAAFFALALAGYILEPPPASRFDLNGQLGGALLMLAVAAVLLWIMKKRVPPPCFEPETDFRDMGLLASLWGYAVAERALPVAASPFGRASGRIRHALPHLVAIQSESFFDARILYAGIRPDVLAAFDRVRAEADEHGPLSVPAWGANTVRTEFAFLTGMTTDQMGVHRFNPYRSVTRDWPAQSLPLLLKKLGYRTCCIHPYWGGFYGRDRVLRNLGFDAFMDITAFAGAAHAGAYVADTEVGERIAQTLQQAVSPTFVFAVTMENHGPLHLEHARPEEEGELYFSPPPSGCDELTVYLRHLRNADRMLDAVRTDLSGAAFPAALCWYGDHVPIMPSAYMVLEPPTGVVPYLCWRNHYAYPDTWDNRAGCESGITLRGAERPLAVHNLALRWLESLQLIKPTANG